MNEAPIRLSEVVEYLDKHRQLLQECHSPYTAEGLMFMLDGPRLQRLQKQFKLYPSGLQLPVFLFTMREILQESSPVDDKYQLVDGLVSLFQSIDVDGDGHLLWQQFTEYIIEAIKRLDSTAQPRAQRDIIEAAYSKLGREYNIQYTAEPNLSNPIRKLVYVDKLQGFLSLEDHANEVKVYTKSFTLKDTLRFASSKWYYYLQDIAVDEEGMMLAALLPDGAYFLPLKYRPGRCVLSCPNLELNNYSSVWWLPRSRYWAFGNSSGELKICSVISRSRSALECNTIYHRRHHTELITMLREIDEPELLCSCSLDGTVKLLSLNSLNICVFDEMERRPMLDSRAKRGYLGFDYSNEFGRIVLLYGFSNTITLHSFDLSLTKGLAGRYSQHSVSIRNARFIRGSPTVVSIDERCSLRIWNFRTNVTQQIIDCEKLFSSQCELIVVPQLDSFYLAERKVCEFKSASFIKRSKELSHRPLDFHYNNYLGGFWMFTSGDGRHYDSLNGRLKQLLTNLLDKKCEFVVTAVQFGPLCRKLYIGDAGGFLREYSTETGEFSQELRPLEDLKEYRQIKKILYVKEEDLLLCASIDGRILVFFRNENSQYVLVRDIRGSHSTDLTGLCYSSDYHLMASSCEGGTVNVWNSVKYTLETVLVATPKVVDIRFVRGYPILLVCCDRDILCFGVKPIGEGMRHRCIFKISNQLNVHDISCFDVLVRKGTTPAEENPNTEKNTAELDSQVLVCIGDRGGTVATLSLGEPFRQCAVERADRIELQEPSHPRRYDHCYIDKQVQALLNRQSSYGNSDDSPVWQLEDIRITSWTAHQGPVVKVKFQRQPLVVMTGGEDQRFKIFEVNGTVCGIVDCESFRSTTWRMPEVNITRRLKQIDFVLYIISLIDRQALTPQQKEAVKARMLVKRYMNDVVRREFEQHITSQRQSRCPSGVCSANSTPALTSQCEIQHPTFRDNYEAAIFNLKDKMQAVDKEIALSRTQHRYISNQLAANIAERRRPTESKEIRSLKAKLQAIEQHLPEGNQPRQQPGSKQKKLRQAKHKNCLFVSYGQLKRNLAAMHKMLRINNIR